jgi:hypothetical protein
LNQLDHFGLLLPLILLRQLDLPVLLHL